MVNLGGIKFLKTDMKNKDRLFVGACCGMPFGLVGMTTGFLFSFLWNTFIEDRKCKHGRKR